MCGGGGSSGGVGLVCAGGWGSRWVLNPRGSGKWGEAATWSDHDVKYDFGFSPRE